MEVSMTRNLDIQAGGNACDADDTADGAQPEYMSR